MHRSHPCSCSCWVPVKIAACQVKVLYIALTFSSCFRAHLTAYVILFRHSVLLKDTHTLFQHLYMFPIIVKLLFSTIGLSLLDCHYCYSASTSTFRSTLKIENKNSRNPTILCHLSKARHPSNNPCIHPYSTAYPTRVLNLSESVVSMSTIMDRLPMPKTLPWISNV